MYPTSTHPAPSIQQDSSSWIFFVKVSFALSVLALGTGIAFLPVDIWIRGYLAMGGLFTVGSTITLTKTMRDHHEAQKLINRINEARAERMLKEEGEGR
ncbi:MAG: YiaA/YiaB family inner membrane protein [Bacteroidota bacterium]